MMIPVRFIAISLGISDDDVLWDADTDSVTITAPDRIVQMFKNSARVIIDDLDGTMFNLNADMLPVEPKVEMLTQIFEDRLYIPFRNLAHAFGIAVSYDPETRIAEFNPESANETANDTTDTTQPTTAPAALPLTVLPNRQLTEAELNAWKANYSGAKDVELELVKLINAERAANGVAPLETNEKLMMAARFKTQSLADLKYFAHSGVYGRVRDLMNAFGFVPATPGATSENLAQGWDTPAKAMQGWLGSPAHRANILNSEFTLLGVGSYNCADKGLLFVLMFSTDAE